MLFSCLGNFSSKFPRNLLVILPDSYFQLVSAAVLINNCCLVPLSQSHYVVMIIVLHSIHWTHISFTHYETDQQNLFPYLSLQAQVALGSCWTFLAQRIGK